MIDIYSDDFVFNKKANALVARGALGTLVLPETMMNFSGKSVSAFIKSPTAATNLLVIHDDLDLPLGTVKTYIHRARNELRIALSHLKP